MTPKHGHPPTVTAIVMAICHREGVTLEQMVAPKTLRERHIRHLVWAALREELSGDRPRWTEREIAGWFGVVRPTVTLAMQRLRGQSGERSPRASPARR